MKYNHISIEGFDGVGKTTVATRIADELHITYVRRALHRMRNPLVVADGFIPLRILDTSVFPRSNYGINSVYMNVTGTKITDRFLVSEYWKGVLIDGQNDETLMQEFECMLRYFGGSAITFLLYADRKNIESRLINRGLDKNDKQELSLFETAYQLMHSLIKRLDLCHVVLDTSTTTVETVTAKIINYLNSSG